MELKIERHVYFDLVVFIVWIERKHQGLQILSDYACMPTVSRLFAVCRHACASHLDCNARMR